MLLLWWLMPVPFQAIAFLAVLIAASALQTQPMQLHERRRVVASVARVEVCTKKHCKKKGSLRLLRVFESLAPEDVEVLTADMSHTEHGADSALVLTHAPHTPSPRHGPRAGCFDECMMGPNVRVDAAGPKADGGPIVNGVRGAAGAAEVLGVDVPEGWELPPAPAK